MVMCDVLFRCFIRGIIREQSNKLVLSNMPQSALTTTKTCKCAYLEHFATLIERNTLKDSNHCFKSFSIRQRSKDLKHHISGNGLPELQGLDLK